MSVSSRSDYINRLFEKCHELEIEDIADNELVSNFIINYDFYHSILDKSLSKGMISVEDKVELYKFRATIITGDLKLMREKKDITEEDIAILKEILQIVDKMREDEENLPSLV